MKCPDYETCKIVFPSGNNCNNRKRSEQYCGLQLERKNRVDIE